MTALYPHLPSTFYDRSDALRRVRRAAFARQVSPDGLLAAALARAAVAVPPTCLVNGATFDLAVGLIGESAQGKSRTFHAAADLIPDIGTPNDGLPIGTGEGIAAILDEEIKKADGSGNPAALFYVDEAEQLIAIGKKREQATTFPTIRSAWSGQTIGSINADRGRRRNVRRGTYRFGIVVGFQPVFAADLMLGVHAGDPQRFLFAAVVHPDVPDSGDFPPPIELAAVRDRPTGSMPVDADVVALMRRNRGRIARGEVVPDPFDAHRDLLTLKVAACLSILESDFDLTLDRWNAATLIVDNSCAVRRHLIDVARVERARRDVDDVEQRTDKRVLTVDRNYDKTIRSMALTMIRHARKSGVPLTAPALYKRTSGEYRRIVDETAAIAYAVETGADGGRLVAVTNGRDTRYTYAPK